MAASSTSRGRPGERPFGEPALSTSETEGSRSSEGGAAQHRARPREPGPAVPESPAPARPKPLKVLYVENGIGYGGAIICLRHLVRHLDRSRYQPLVVTGLGGPLYEPLASDGPWVHIPDRHLDVTRARTWVDRDAPLGRVPVLGWLARQAVARLDDVANFLPFFVRLLALMRRERPALVHANNEPLCNRAAVLAGRLLGVPVVSHIRGNPEDVRIGRWLYRLPDHYLCVSRWVSEGVGRLGVPPEKRQVVYDGIALDQMDVAADGARFRERYGIPAGRFAVGLVGLLIPWKGQAMFLDAARRLRERIPGLVMAIVGGTPQDYRWFEAELKARVAAEGLSDVVRFTGHVGEMPPVYNGLDVVVSASISPEPLGTMVIEALAMARPLLVPDHGGGAEMVEHERTGLIFRAGDAESLAAAIARLHADPALRERLGQAARAKALSTFAVEAHARQVQAVYDRLLARAGAGPAGRGA